jgi:FG-GAP repeat
MATLLLLISGTLFAGTVFAPVQIFDTGFSQANSVAAADLNGDGKPDLVITGCVGG